jgi:SAM-dependent methyltransferase
MHGLGAADPGRHIDWGRTSGDYAAFRPGPPDSFYEKLAALGIGRPGQRIVDLGTGTGVLARHFAAAGARCAGTDISAEQIETAQRLARESGLEIDFRVAPAEATGFANGSFDAVTASQCWLYFDAPRAIAEARRVAPRGRLMVGHFSWLPRLDPIARASEELVLRFNPQWSAADWAGEVPPLPRWAEGLRLAGFFVYDAAIPFTHESWRGRIRACRGVGAGLSPGEVAAFDAAHAALLARIAPSDFTVLHRLDARIFALDP